MRTKLIILGGGASGLMAACAAARILKTPQSVLVLEGNGKCGRKLLATGNGRCNLTNLRDMRADRFYGDGAALAPLLFAYPPERVRTLFREMSLETSADREGRVYPKSMQSSSVLSVLLREAAHWGVSFRCGASVSSVSREKKGFRFLCADGEVYESDACILAVGGAASPKLSLGGGYPLVKALGHTVTPLFPALTGLLCETSRKALRPLAGVRAAADVTLLANGKRAAFSKAGEKSEVIFSENGVSGISVFDLTAKAYRELSSGSACALRLDLLPGLHAERVADFLQKTQARYGDSPAGELLMGLLPAQIGWALVRALGTDPDAPAASLSEERLQNLAALTKGWEFPVTGTRGFENAQITAGGVPMSEIDPLTMRSAVVPGLYLSGELLNVHGPCGGYNLHLAWATGHAAGTAAARTLLGGRA